MATVKDIVEINITRDTRGVTRQGFGTPLFIGSTQGVLDSSDRVRRYTSAETLLGEGFSESDDEYKAALRYFSQTVGPTAIKIGYHDTTGSETIPEAYDAIKAQDDDFYFVSTYSSDAADIEAMSDVIESEDRIYGASYTGSDATDSNDDTDIGSTLQDKGNQRTFLFYADDPSEFPECAIIGLQAPKDPGSTTWKFKELSSVTVSEDLSSTVSARLRGGKFDMGKGYNTYEPVGGRKIFREGRMVGGEFIDQKVA